MIRVQIKASSPLLKRGLESLLRAIPSLRVVQDSSVDAQEVESGPHVLVAEAAMLSDPGAREAIEWAAAGGPVVLLLHNPSAESVLEALRAGIKAVLASDADSPAIGAAIEAAAAGLVVLEPETAERVFPPPNALAAEPPSMPAEALTPREIEVLRLLATGLGNKEIAARLEISEHTVKFHVASIMGKLGAVSRTEAVTRGIHYGLIMI